MEDGLSRFTTWRDAARPIVRDVLIANKGKTEKEIRAALREAYPFGERKYHPYKIWCDEVNKQLHPVFGTPLSKQIDPEVLRNAFKLPVSQLGLLGRPVAKKLAALR